MAIMHVHPTPSSVCSLGILLGLKDRDCVREVSLTLCGSAHTSGCVVDGIDATAAY